MPKIPHTMNEPEIDHRPRCALSGCTGRVAGTVTVARPQSITSAVVPEALDALEIDVELCGEHLAAVAEDEPLHCSIG